MQIFATGDAFEDEVRRIARLLWPSAAFDGASMEDGRERDGIFETDEFIHVVECTTSRARDKAEGDGAKIAKLMRKLVVRHPTKFIKGWFVTLEEPTAEQRTAIRAILQKEKTGSQIVAASFDQFRSRLVDARSYLSARRLYAFGSVRDPESGAHDFDLSYVPIELLDTAGNLSGISTVASALLQGSGAVFLGDYGAGKSSTLRELFIDLMQRFWRNDSLRFPILLNLRDHHGQTDPVEALERHARNIGFSPPDALVRAWRSGYGIILLDGFDEIAAAGWAGKTRTLKELRYRSMELVRKFVSQTPTLTGIAIAGRAHFFDNNQEMDAALSLKPSMAKLYLSEFTTHQVTQFLGRLGWHDPIPDWLPSRPLLLAYLAGEGLLLPALRVDAAADPASGWDNLMTRIAQREAELEAGIDAETVRRLIEHLAMIARSSADGFGPLAPEVIVEAFRIVCGHSPDDRGAVLLQRLPGLGAHNREDGSRVFIDKDFVEAARGAAISRIIENPYVMTFVDDSWQNVILPLGAQVAGYRVLRFGHTTGKVTSSLRHVLKQHEAFTIAADILLVLIELGGSVEEQLFLREVVIPELLLEDPESDLRLVEFQDSVVGELVLSPDFPDERMPRFRNCHFGRVEGRTGERDLPGSRFERCDYDVFDQPANTTNAIMNLSLPLGSKVMLTIFKKLYAQSGGGRKEQAFYRGLDSRARNLVPEVLSLLRKSGFATRSARGVDHVWLPTRTSESRRRALSMLAAPNASLDPLLRESRDIG
jgi:hypothetical protein